ncbi:PLP-dependent aminotransferase family protein [Streptomyces sp. NBC_00597]|uniref:aminotransferase-like domain-containing protein n=1 Tax=unclassified Streptomyces TaxID=2593676 RepID=UPI002E0DA6CC|nr:MULTISPECIES: PLP-dependent aminotransferase family protein [unclassified Streptomyces]WSR22536.1 PLP-dependent aminotransferase family protein [Streptomyces sp. NBC_01205]
MVLLNPSRLHSSLRAPVLGSIGFLNEVMGRFPDAISFAPGAPHPETLPDPDLQHYTDRFLDHLVELGASPERARRTLFEYGPSRGLINDIISDALRRDHALDTSPDDLVVTVGAQEGMLLVLRALFGSAQDVLAVADPCFVGITGAARLLDVDVVPVAETPRGLDLDGLERSCREARRAGRAVRALYVAPDFSNPGGGRMPLDCRHRLLELAEREDFLVLEDNAYGFTAGTDDGLPLLKALDTARRVIHIGTFAKVAFPGARIGYVVADQPVAAPGGGTLPLAAELATLKTMVTVNTSPLPQAVIGGMLLEHGGSLTALSRRKSELYQRNLGCLAQALDRHLTGAVGPGVHWNRPEGGFFIRVHLPVRADAALLEVSAAKYGVLWTPMEHFYVGGGGEQQIRLSCSYLDPGEIDEGVRRLSAFLTKEIGT